LSAPATIVRPTSAPAATVEDGRSAAPGRGGGAGPLAWLIAGLLVLPVAVGIAGAALPAFGYLPALGGEAPSLGPLRQLLAEPGLGRSVALSLTAGLITPLVSLAGVLLFVAAFAGTRVFTGARHALGPLLAVPHAAAAFGLAFLIAPSGLLFRGVATLSGETLPPDVLIVGDPAGLAMMAGLVIKETPFLLLVVYAALPQADALRRLDVARSLGYGRLAGFVLAVWPAVYRQIRLPVLAVVAYASSVVDVALILGPSQPAPLAVRIVEWASDPDLSRRFLASAGALLQAGVTLAAIAGWIALERAGGALCRWAAGSGHRLAAEAPLRVAAPLVVGLAAAALGLGLAVLAVWSVAGLWSFPALLPETVQAGTWSRALAGAAGPLATTAIVAAASTALALVLVVALLEAVRRAAPGPAEGAPAALPPTILTLLHVPLIVPQVAFVFGLQVLILSAGLRPALVLLVGAHLVFVAPYVAIALAEPWLALDRRYERIAASLGHGPLRTFVAVRLRMLLGPILTAAAIGFATSVGLYLPTLLIGGGRLPTITTEAVALASGANSRTIGAYALLQAALPLLAFAVAAAVPSFLARRRLGMRA
jgi:putative thiamine transport system permease protein